MTERSTARARVITLLIAAMFLLPSARAEETPVKKIEPGKPLTADELASLLGVQIWKLHATPPAGAKRVRVWLQVHERGKEPRPFGTSVGGLTELGDGTVVVAIVPVGGQSVIEAEKVRVTLDAFGTQGSGIDANPLRSMGIGRPGRPEKRDDGTLDLIGGFRDKSISNGLAKTADTVISLKITASE